MNSKPIHVPQKKSTAVTPNTSTPALQDTHQSSQAARVTGSIDDLVKLRNDTLIEFYCVSRLSDLLDFTTKESLEDEIHAFLSKNDIEGQNVRFQVSTLPNIEPNRVKQDIKIKRESLSSSLSDKLVKATATATVAATVPTVPTASTGTAPPKQVESSNFGKAKRTAATAAVATESVAGASGTSRRIKRAKVTPSTTGEGVPSTHRYVSKDGQGTKAVSLPPPSTSITAERTGQRLPLTSAAVVTKSREAAEKLVPVRSTTLPPTIVPASTVSTGITKIEPTQVTSGNVKKYKVPIVESLNRQLEDTSEEYSIDYHLYDNVDTGDKVFMVLEENVPSMVPHSTSLTELRYMAQTLPLINLLPRAYKALSTDIINSALNETRMSIVSSRIEELKRAGLWSLRQPKKFVDSDTFDNSRTHYSTLLAEAKWMQTDFSEGLRYKIAVSMMLAREVMKYWKYGKEACCVNVKRCVADGTKGDEEADNKQNLQTEGLLDNNMEQTHSIGEQISGTIDPEKLLVKSSPDEDENQDTDTQQEHTIGAHDYTPLDDGYPANIFKLAVSYDALNSVERNVLEGLSLYSGIPPPASFESDTPLFSPEKNMFVPVSESTTFLDTDHFHKIVERQIADNHQNVDVLSKKRGLFLRSETNSYLRPPPVPSLRYLQNRAPTIWLPEDDQELVNNINTYSYNWELISSQMTRRPTRSYLSNVEKRTPWQCFERFVQLNEKFTFSDLKGSRAPLAQQWLIEAHKFQQRQNRRISPLGVGNDSIQRGNRRLRWASMFEVIRKSIKRRENATKPVKVQVRKTPGLRAVKMPTPGEMSQIKAQRDEAARRELLAQKEARYRFQQSQYQAFRAAQARLQAKAEAQGSQSRAGGFAVPAVTRVGLPGGGGADSVRKSLEGVDKSSSSDKANTPQNRSQNPPWVSSEPLPKRDIINSYSKKILAQKPNIPPETAWKIAENYYRSIQEQHQLQLAHRQQQQQQLLQSQMQQQLQHMSSQVKPLAAQQQYPLPQNPYWGQQMSSTHSQQTDKNVQQSVPQGFNVAPIRHVNNAKTVKSPTPYEILQRFQK